jgi:hypothetical protein
MATKNKKGGHMATLDASIVNLSGNPPYAMFSIINFACFIGKTFGLRTIQRGGLVNIADSLAWYNKAISNFHVFKRKFCFITNFLRKFDTFFYLKHNVPL